MNKELRALKRENRKLRKQNEYLTHRIDMLSGAKQGGAQAQIHKKMRLQSASGFWAYNLLRIKSTAAYAIYDKAMFTLRKYVFASNLILIAKYIIAIVHGSVALVVAAGVLAVTLPVLGLMTLSAFLVGLILQRKWNTFFRGYLRGKRVYLFFHIRRGRSEKYYLDTAKALSENAVILVICDSLFKAKDVCASHVGNNVYYIYAGYYFRLKILLRSPDIESIMHIY